MFDYVANRSLPVQDDLLATLERFEGRVLRGKSVAGSQ